ncbi:unnamed protein product [Psylliodes chrysocephalus]|uniref:CCHC-type domain-containing protein n=1 Tax=Psylliodes chrysocephalus TaxID=3402493 RepID=A0A9P0GFG1_9CUCU|nr:unnamed protein product [Psylliodes chrysocephala]
MHSIPSNSDNEQRSAKKLLTEEYLTIGVVRCTIEKRIRMSQCYRCWSYNHRINECNGPDRSKHCYKCGENDHMAKYCENLEKCPICNTIGHKAGTLKCKAFRTALTRARNEEKKKQLQTTKRIAH